MAERRRAATRKAAIRKAATGKPWRKTTPRKSRPARKKTSRKAPAKRWSQRVTRESDALDLDRGVFKLGDPKKIAASLKRSAERSKRRKASPYRSAMSMLNFYINRAGKDLPARRKRVLERAKDALRAAFHKPAKKKTARR